MTRRIAAPKDREYLEGLNLKQLQKTQKPTADQDKREFYQGLQDQAKSGPVFSADVLRVIERAPEMPKHVTKWLGNLAKDATEFAKLEPRGLAAIIKWSQQPTAVVRLEKLHRWDDVLDAAQDWATHGDDDSGKFEKNKVVYQFSDGWRVVELETENDILLEGTIVQNCLRDPKHKWWDQVKSGQTTLYSLRTPANSPRVDLEVSDDGLRQCFGKQNKPPLPKYNKYLVEFFGHMKLYSGFFDLDITQGDVAFITDDTWAHLITNFPRVVIRWISRNSIVLPEAAYTLCVQKYTSKSSGLGRLIAEDANTPESVVALMANHKDPELLIRIAHRKSLSADTIRTLLKGPNNVKEVLAARQDLPDDVVVKLAQDSTNAVRHTLCAYATTLPERAAVALASDPDIAPYLAERSDIVFSEKVIALLAKNGDGLARTHLARRPNLPERIALQLAGTEVALDLARNEPLSEKVLLVLAKSKNPAVLKALASRGDLTSKSGKALAETSHFDVLTKLCRNNKAPDDVLDLVFKQILVKHNSLSKVLANREARDLVTDLVYNPRTPASVLDKLSVVNDPDIYNGVAGNHNTSPHVLDRMIGITGVDRPEGFQPWLSNVELAKNRNISEQALLHLAQTGGDHLEYVAKNPNITASVIRALLSKGNLQWRVRILQGLRSNASLPQEVKAKLPRK